MLAMFLFISFWSRKKILNLYDLKSLQFKRILKSPFSFWEILFSQKSLWKCTIFGHIHKFLWPHAAIFWLSFLGLFHWIPFVVMCCWLRVAAATQAQCLGQILCSDTSPICEAKKCNNIHLKCTYLHNFQIHKKVLLIVFYKLE